MIDYAARLNNSMQQNMPSGQPGPMAGYQLSVKPGASLTPDQQGIVEMMLGFFNNPSMLENAKSRGPK